MSAALYTLVRYLVAAGAGWLVQRGFTVGEADGATLDAVAQIILGVAGVVIPAAIGVWRSRVPALLARLKAYHRTDLLAAAADVPGVQKIIAAPGLADAVPSEKVVAPSG